LFPLRFPSNNPDFIVTTLLIILPRKTIRIISGKSHSIVSLLACAFDYSEILHAKKSAPKPTSLLFAPMNETHQSDGKQTTPHISRVGGQLFQSRKRVAKKETFF
jgi:hypothetical protein